MPKYEAICLRNRENGKIILHSKVYLDSGVRLVAAREGKIEIGYGSEIGGKSKLFSRPVIIFRKLAHGFYFVIPDRKSVV
jgi:hypothetical protein